MDVSFFPYRTFKDYLNNKEIDDTYQFLLQTIKILSDNLEYILIDGARNKDIVNFFMQDYVLVDYTMLPINSNKSHRLYIYKHKTQSTFLIYYECFLYGLTCPSEHYVEKLAKYIKQAQGKQSNISKFGEFAANGNIILSNADKALPIIQAKQEYKKNNEQKLIKPKSVKSASFIIKYGNSPETIRPLLHINNGDKCILVFDNKVCVGVVWEHYDSKNSEAMGQAEIRFFERYRNSYGLWHRMFVNEQRISYDRLQSALNESNEYIYWAKIKRH